jgi:diguanylate cyclase (GGDEF)-like protein
VRTRAASLIVAALVLAFAASGALAQAGRPPPPGGPRPDFPPPPGAPPPPPMRPDDPRLQPPRPEPPAPPPTPPAFEPLQPAAAPAVVDELVTGVERARAAGDATQLVQALLRRVEGRVAQGRGREATSAIDEAAAIAARIGDDRLGRETARVGTALYEALGDTELARAWRTRADAYRARIEGSLATVPPLPAPAAAAMDPALRTDAANDASQGRTDPAAPVPAPKWPWLLAIASFALLALWWRTHRRAASLGAETERLARHQRHLRSAHNELQRQAEHLRQTATQDALTGALTRQAFAHALDQLLQHAERFGQPAALFVFDLDHFKQINDGHGHLTGDEALKLVVGVTREKLDSNDLLGRFGGDEFLVAAIRDNPDEFLPLAESLRSAVRDRVAGDPVMGALSLSLGIAVVTEDRDYAPGQLFARADAALYAAKRGGRNRCVLADDQPFVPTADAPLRSLAD